MTNFGRQDQGKPSGTDLADITIVAGRIDNVESALVGNLSLNLLDINGAAIDGTVVGANSPSTGVFTTLNASTLYVCGTVSGTVAFASQVSTLGSITIASAFTTGGVLTVASESTFNASITVTSQVTTSQVQVLVGGANAVSGAIAFSTNSYFYGYDGSAWLPLASGWA